MACECKDVFLVLGAGLMMAVPLGLVLCGTLGISHFATKTMPKYCNYKEEERHHVTRTCGNLTITSKGTEGNSI